MSSLPLRRADGEGAFAMDWYIQADRFAVMAGSASFCFRIDNARGGTNISVGDAFFSGPAVLRSHGELPPFAAAVRRVSGRRLRP